MLIKVKVKTEAKEEHVKKISDDSFLVSVREKAERGLANARVLTLLRRHLGKGAGVRMVKGRSLSSKIFEVVFR